MATESFFSNASLAYLASAGAGKDGKTYSIKPTDGTGDFTFSRGSNLAATRVGADGLIEKGRENLLLQSNQFDTTWGKSNTSVTSGHSGYDGSSDAWKLIQNTTNTFHYIKQDVSTTSICTYSVYAKAGEYSGISFFFPNVGGASTATTFNLSTGTFVNNTHNAASEDVGGGWYRISLLSKPSGTQGFNTYVNQTIQQSEAGDGTSGIYIQDAQLEIGLAATDYIETGATTGKAGLLEDEPRFDYSGGATCPSLLLEPSRTNLLEYSEYFEDTTIYDLRSADIVTNYAISPEGVQNATKVIPQNGTTNFRIQTQNTFGVSGDNVLSVFAKYETGGFQYLILATNSAFQTYAFDIQNGTKVGNAGGATIADEDATIELIGNGWYRCSIKSNNTGIADGVIYLSDDGTNANATGDGSKGMLIYGFQGEANASYPTSYIPNHSGGSVTRGADDCDGAGNSDVINSTEGVLYAEMSVFEGSDNTFAISLNDGSASNRIFVSLQSPENTYRAYASSSLGTSNIIFTGLDVTTISKIAVRYSSSGFSLWVNGQERGTTTFSGMNALNNFSFDRNGGGELPFYGNTKKVLYFPEALSEADCIALTTL